MYFFSFTQIPTAIHQELRAKLKLPLLHLLRSYYTGRFDTSLFDTNLFTRGENSSPYLA